MNVLRFLPLLVGLSLQNLAQAPDAEMLLGGQMEPPFRNGVAQGWVPNCYGSNEVAFAEQSNDVHEGRAAQRVTCTRFNSGGVQFHSADIAVEKGKAYTLRLWMKGDVKGPIYVGIRKHGEPYTPYLKRDLRVRKDWTPYLITGQPSDTDSRCAIYIMFTGTGTLLVDDVSLKPGIHEEAVLEVERPVQKGNRIYNSGLEAGSEGWAPVNGFSLDEQVAHSGRFSARLDAAPVQGARGGIECRPFPVRTGRRYTLSAWIKAADPDTRVQLRLFEWADRGGDSPENRHEREVTIRASNEWMRYQLSGILLPNLHEGYVARIVPSSRIWLDDVQVEEGNATDYQAAHPVEVGAETKTRWCRVGDTVQVTARTAAAAGSDSLKLEYTLENLWSRPLTNVEHRAKSGHIDRADFVVREPGMYRVRVQAEESPATGEVWFGVFPQRDRRLQADSPFGTHATSVVGEPGNTMLASEAMGARWVRLHDFGDFCHWWRVEPEKAGFVWYDAEVDALRARGFLIFANLGHPPRWAGRDQQKQKGSGWTPAPPRDIAEWENYVFRTVEHYRNRIQHWEVWNEPYWKGFFAGTPEEYAALLRVAYGAIKRADPQAIVVGGCFAPTELAWTRRVLAAGALEFMDALSYHVYWSPPLTESTEPGAAPAIAQQVERFKDLMREHGQVKPIYMTEGGIRCPPFASWLPQDGFERSAPFGSETGAGEPLTGLEAASGLVRGMVEMLSAGAEKVFYYYSGGVSGATPWFSTMANGYYVLTDFDGRPKPTMMAYSALESLLAGAKPVRVSRHEGLSVHLFARDHGTVAVVWSTRARPLALAPGVSIFDLMGNEMKPPALNPDEPAYVVAQSLTPAQLERMVTACTVRDGGIIRGPIDHKRLAIVFTAHEDAEGAETILRELTRHRGHGSFFLTGTFISAPESAPLLARLKAAGHYIGPHSDEHLLYCTWDSARKTLVTREQFRTDLARNMSKLPEPNSESRHNARYFLPPFEQYNSEIATWTAEMGLTLINFTPGTRSNADYTGEADANFVSSQVILDSIIKREREDPSGLNGFILLLHMGSGPGRRDKFHDRFGELLDYLQAKGYEFVRVDELLAASAR